LVSAVGLAPVVALAAVVFRVAPLVADAFFAGARLRVVALALALDGGLALLLRELVDFFVVVFFLVPADAARLREGFLGAGGGSGLDG